MPKDWPVAPWSFVPQSTQYWFSEVSSFSSLVKTFSCKLIWDSGADDELLSVFIAEFAPMVYLLMLALDVGLYGLGPVNACSLPMFNCLSLADLVGEFLKT